MRDNLTGSLAFDEARVLLGQPIADVAEMREAGRQLARQYGCAFLMKGGHLRDAIATDLLVHPDGTFSEYSAPFVPGVSTHGTGCTYSAAVASGLPSHHLITLPCWM